MQITNYISPHGSGPAFETDRSKYGAEDYLHEIELWLEHRSPYRDQWERNERHYDVDPSEVGNMEAEERLGRAFGLIQTEVANLINASPKFFATDLVGDQEEVALLFEKLVNNDWALRRDKYREVMLCVLDTAIYNFGVILNSYEADFAASARRRKARNNEIQQAADSGVLQGHIAAKMTETEIPFEEAPELTYEQDLRIVGENVASRRVSPWDFIGDPTARNWSELRVWGRRIEIHKQDLLKGPFDQGVVSRLKGGDIGSWSNYWPSNKTRAGNLGSKRRSLKQDFVTIFELWDVRTNELVTVAPGSSEFLRRQENPYPGLWHPYSVLSWNTRGEGILGRSDLGQVRGMIEEEETLRAKARDGLEREAIDVYLMDKRLGLGEDAIEPMTLPEGSLLLPIEVNPGVNIAQMFAKLPREAKTPELFGHLATIKGEIQDCIGFGPNQLGSALKSGSSATEAATINTYAQNKTQYRHLAVEAFVADVAWKRSSLMALFYDERKIRHLVGKEGAQLWAVLGFSDYEISERFSIRVEEGSLSPTNDAVRSATYMQLLQFGLQVPGFAQALDMNELLLRFLESRGIKDGSSLLTLSREEFAAALATAQERFGTGGGSQEGGRGAAPTAAGQNQEALGAIQSVVAAGGQAGGNIG